MPSFSLCYLDAGLVALGVFVDILSLSFVVYVVCGFEILLPYLFLCWELERLKNYTAVATIFLESFIPINSRFFAVEGSD